MVLCARNAEKAATVEEEARALCPEIAVRHAAPEACDFGPGTPLRLVEGGIRKAVAGLDLALVVCNAGMAHGVDYVDGLSLGTVERTVAANAGPYVSCFFLALFFGL